MADRRIHSGRFSRGRIQRGSGESQTAGIERGSQCMEDILDDVRSSLKQDNTATTLTILLSLSQLEVPCDICLRLSQLIVTYFDWQ